MKRTAFTWIELLVVLFIFLVLAAVLFPVFARRPHRGSCQSPLKQISLGFKQYIQDYDGYFPKSNIVNPPLTSGPLTATYWVASLQPYVKSVQIFQCPIEPGSLGTDYYMNSRVSGQPERKFNNSASTVLLTEGVDVADASKAVATAPQIIGGNPPPYARHLDGSNYAFVDGHVKWLQSTRAPGQAKGNSGKFTFQP